jgi:hypothetical protein
MMYICWLQLQPTNVHHKRIFEVYSREDIEAADGILGSDDTNLAVPAVSSMSMNMKMDLLASLVAALTSSAPMSWFCPLAMTMTMSMETLAPATLLPPPLP